MNTFNVGDVVALKSNPTFPMSVREVRAEDNTFIYYCDWIVDGTAKGNYYYEAQLQLFV